MVNSDNLSAQVERKVSRRRLVRDSALTAGALALASQIDVKYALGQDEGPVKIGWLEIGPRCRALSGHLRSPERHRLRELLSRQVVESAKKPHRVLFYPACSQDPTSTRLHFLVICLIAHRVRSYRVRPGTFTVPDPGAA